MFKKFGDLFKLSSEKTEKNIVSEKEAKIEELAQEGMKAKPLPGFKSGIDLFKESVPVTQEIKTETKEEPVKEIIEEPRREYVLPDVDLLDKAERPSREQIADVRNKGEFISNIFNSNGITCDFIEGSINESLTTIKLNLKRKGDLQRYLDAVDVLMQYPGYQNVFCYPMGNEDNTVIILLPDENGLKLSTVLEKDHTRNKMAYALGEDFHGNPVFGDLTKNRNLLITGRGMCGKTTLIQSLMISLLMKNKPEELKFVIADSSVLNYVYFKEIPHLLWPIINTDNDETFINLLKKLIVICEERRSAFASTGVKTIEAFNDYIEESNNSIEDENRKMRKMSYVVVVVDEIDSLLAGSNKKEFAQSFIQLANICSTVGVYLVMATKNFDRGTYYDDIRRLFNGRISYAASTTGQSRIALETEGAETLNSNGEILYRETGFGSPKPVITPLISDDEIQKVCKFIKNQAKPDYDDAYFEFLTNSFGSNAVSNSDSYKGADDSIYNDVVEFVRVQQKASTSLLQRRFGIGYNRAARLIDALEDRGVIGPANGDKPREVYLK